MTDKTDVSEEVKKLAFEKNAQVKIYQLYLLTEIINLASIRGAFKGPELSQVGALFDTLSTGINKAYEIAKEELKSLPTPNSLSPIQEEESAQN